MASDHVLTLTDDNWATEVEQSDVPVLVDFWAPWCGPCRAVGPVVTQIAEEMAGKVKVGKLDVDDNQDVAMRFRITSIPAIKVFKNGEEVDGIVGARPKSVITALVEKNL